jgi:hypothetical protein
MSYHNPIISVLQFLDTISDKLNENEKTNIINSIYNLNWEALENHKNMLLRINILSPYFVLQQIIQKSNNNELIDKVALNKNIVNNDFYKMQIMLWNILNS